MPLRLVLLAAIFAALAAPAKAHPWQQSYPAWPWLSSPGCYYDTPGFACLRHNRPYYYHRKTWHSFLRHGRQRVMYYSHRLTRPSVTVKVQVFERPCHDTAGPHCHSGGAPGPSTLAVTARTGASASRRGEPEASSERKSAGTALNGAPLVKVMTAANLPIVVAASLVDKFLGFVADLVASGYTPRHIGSFAACCHVTHSRHYAGAALDIDQHGWGKTAPPMYHVTALARKWGPRGRRDVPPARRRAHRRWAERHTGAAKAQALCVRVSFS